MIIVYFMGLCRCIKYIGILDGGSTGTRFYIFGFSERGYILKSVWSERVGGGIAQKKVDDIYDGIMPLLEHGERYLLSNGIDPSTVKVALNATAGVRLLSYKDQKNIIEEVRRVLKKSLFDVETRETKVISGGLEGIYMWETLYILKLYFNGKVEDEMRYGVIEMGGASAQIAYKLKPRKKNELLLYSESFLGLGEKEAMNALEKNKEYSKCKKDIKNCSKIIDNLLKEIAAPPEDINQLDQIHLTGFFYYKLIRFYAKEDKSTIKTSLIEIKNKFKDHCHHSKNNICHDFMYLIKFLEYFHVTDNQELIILKEVHGFPLEWTLARAIELLDT